MKYSLLVCSVVSFTLSAASQTESVTYYEGTILRQPITLTKKIDDNQVTYTQEFKHSEIHLLGYTFPLKGIYTSDRSDHHWTTPRTTFVTCTKNKTSGAITGERRSHPPKIVSSKNSLSIPIHDEETYRRLKALYTLKSQKTNTGQH